MYRFKTQKRKGAEIEQELDAYFGQSYDLRRATPEQQRQGIDRVFVHDGSQVTVEYKADWTAHTSNNAFIEVQVGDKPGWALTCQAQAILYYVPQRKTGYWLLPPELRAQLRGPWRNFPRKTVHNCNFVAVGILVPLAMLANRIHIQTGD